MIPTELIVWLVILVLIFSIIGSAVRVLYEYQRGVVFRLGRFAMVKGPGLRFVIPVVDKMVKVSLRTVAMDVPPQDVITKDNVSVKVNAVLYFRVVEPEKALIEVEDYLYATSQLAQTTLRSVLGQAELDELLSRARPHQPAAAGDPRPADRPLGSQGLQRRDQARRPAAGDAARHGPPGRGRARAARQGDPRRRANSRPSQKLAEAAGVISRKAAPCSCAFCRR